MVGGDGEEGRGVGGEGLVLWGVDGIGGYMLVGGCCGRIGLVGSQGEGGGGIGL